MKITNNIGPLISVEYPATTSDSVSAWSNGARLDSINKTRINVAIIGEYIKAYQYVVCVRTKSWKFEDWDESTSIE